jgi:hypothetical protein
MSDVMITLTVFRTLARRAAVFKLMFYVYGVRQSYKWNAVYNGKSCGCVGLSIHDFICHKV